jgi:hypothetical protein
MRVPGWKRAAGSRGWTVARFRDSRGDHLALDFPQRQVRRRINEGNTEMSFDGTYFDESNQGEVTEHDVDGDGVIDSIEHTYGSNTITEIDEDGDGVMDSLYHDSDGSGDGTIEFSEHDLNGDGVIDVTLYDTDGDGEPDEVETDLDNDGEVDDTFRDTDGDGNLDSKVDPDTGELIQMTHDEPVNPFAARG